MLKDTPAVVSPSKGIFRVAAFSPVIATIS
jgi:hypothetical protein